MSENPIHGGPSSVSFTRLVDAIDLIRALAPEMKALTATLFLKVCEHGEVPMSDLVAYAEAPTSTVGRHLQTLLEWERVRVPGLGLIKTYDDAADRRRKIVALTAKGREVRTAIAGVIGGA